MTHHSCERGLCRVRLRRIGDLFGTESTHTHPQYSNGELYARAGTALVALQARSHNVPVIVCAATLKFTHRVQIDAITSNEIGDPDALIATPSNIAANALQDWRDIKPLKLLNMLYDLTPPSLISVIVCEAGLIPPSSVLVILRERAELAHL